MKKTILALVAVFAMGMNMNSFAAKVNTGVENFNFRYNVETMSNHLQLNDNQRAQLEEISDEFTLDMNRAGRSKDDKKVEKINRAVRRNISKAHHILTPEQYKKYLQVLNLTLENHRVRHYMN